MPTSSSSTRMRWLKVAGSCAAPALLRCDGASGTLAKITDYPLEGVLPEGGTFDLAGEHFLATMFHGHAGTSADAAAGLETFRVVKGETPRLERLGRIPMPHGVHHVVVTR